MRTVWHIFKKDVLRLRWPLAGWLALPLAQMIYVAVAPAAPPDNAAYPEMLGWVFQSITGIQVLLTFLLVMSLLDDDPLVGNRAFWQTRPISGAQLFGAKLLGLVALLWLLPVALDLPWWLTHSYGGRELVTAIIEVTLTQAFITALALPLAAMAPKSGVFLAIAGGWVVMASVGMSMAATLATGPTPPVGVMDSRGMLSFWIWLGTVTMVTANQFLTRRTLRSAVVFALGWICMGATANWWPWDFSSLVAIKTADSPLTVTLRLEPQETSVTLLQRKNAFAVFMMRMRLAGVPAPYAVTLDFARHTFNWGQESVTLRSDLPGSQQEGGAFEQARAKALGHETPVQPFEVRMMATVASREDTERLLQSTPAYRSALRGRMLEPIVVADVPLRVGACGQRRGYGLCIEMVQPPEQGRRQVTVRVFAPDFLADGANPFKPGDNGRPGIPEFFFAVNRRSGTAEQLHISTPETLGRVGTLWTYWLRLNLPVDMPPIKPAAEAMTAANDEIRLVRVVLLPVAEFERTIAVPRLEVSRRPQ
jgi:hypothetical protein